MIKRDTYFKEVELNSEEDFLIGMIQSCYTYGQDFMTSKYSKEYIDKLGYDKVKKTYDNQIEFLKQNYEIKRNVYTDYEGGSYNALVKKEEV